jgi:hypothetical protein
MWNQDLANQAAPEPAEPALVRPEHTGGVVAKIKHWRQTFEEIAENLYSDNPEDEHRLTSFDSTRATSLQRDRP